MGEPFRYLSVCSGIEAASVAWHPLGWQCVGLSEIEPFPRAVLEQRLGAGAVDWDHRFQPGRNSIPMFGDFTQIEAHHVGPVDLLVGGTPCQSFSVAGKRLGLDDPRGNLALEYLALARRTGARWIVWENVPGVLSSYSGSEQAERAVREGDVGGEGDGFEERDFATFLSFVRECGYGFAYRVLDAQYVRVDGLERAVPQRRRRVILVGHLGDWRRAAAVLLEREGLRGDPAPRRQAGEGVAPNISARPSGGGGLGTDFDCDGGLIASFGGGNTSGPIDVAACLTAKGQRIDFEVETFVAQRANTLLAKANDSLAADLDTYVAHTLRAEGFDASEDGTGRGTPIVPICFDTTQITSVANGSNPQPGDPCHPLAAGAHPPCIAFDCKGTEVQVSTDGSHPTLRSMGHHNSHQNAGGHAAVAYDLRGREGGAQFEGPHDTANIRAANGGSSKSYIAEQWAVRRLTPTECERLQGFPDGWTDIRWRGKAAAPDGPRYKALGNSMAVNVMRWVGERIDAVEGLAL